ncbi:MAG: MBOAT family protein [Gallionella sp.]|nr:MBOAT family protein [Gallionella sp.]
MLFNSYEFLFLFLPIVFAGFFWLARFDHKVSALWLACASLFFYGWWSPKYVGLLLVSIIVNYSLAYLIGNKRSHTHAKLILIFAISANFSLLGYYKYANFFIGTTNWMSGGSLHPVDIILPLGISFFTFTQIAFLVDVYRGVAREYNFIHYLLFVTYFPHLIAGPVLHHGQMMPQFARRETYRLQLDNVALGLSIFTIGLAKKVLLADNFGDYASPVFAAAGLGIQPDFIEAWTGALAYTLQLYFDFSGYSDMAIGISMLFGVKLPINFNSPYKAANIIDFWRRWHMTLSQFLRDYLYIPLGGNRNGRFMRHMNLMITMLLGGLWHGANWTFVIWGGLHGMYLVVNHTWQSLLADRLPTQGIPARIYYLAATLLTFLCVVIAWVFFRAESFSSALLVLKGCFGYGGISLPSKLGALAESLGPLGSLLPAGMSYGGVFLNIPGMGSMGGIAPLARLLALGLLIVWLAPNSQQFFSFVEQTGKREKLFNWTISWQPKPVVGFIIGCVFCLAISKLDKVSTFLYYQF